MNQPPSFLHAPSKSKFMLSSTSSFLPLSLSLLTLLLPAPALSQTIPVVSSPPAGYETGFSTQDHESPGQQSICNTNCPGLGALAAAAGGTTSGPASGLPAGVYAAAINPAMGGGAADCGACGGCYELVNSRTPLCEADAGGCP